MRSDGRKTQRPSYQLPNAQSWADAASRLLVNDGMEPVQMARGRPEQGERMLLEAVLVEAIALVLDVTVLSGAGRHKHGRDGRRGEGRAVIQEAKDWLRGAPAPFPFEFVCQHLNLEPEAVRRAVFAGDRPALTPLLGVHASPGSWGAGGTSGSG